MKFKTRSVITHKSFELDSFVPHKRSENKLKDHYSDNSVQEIQ